MIEFLIEIRQYTSYLIIGLFAIVFISLFLFSKSKQITKVIIGFGLLCIVAIFSLLLNEFIRDSLRSEITDMVEIALKKDSKVLINGNEAKHQYAIELLTDLTKIDGLYFTHKSSPKTKYLISIISQSDTLDIVLRRDAKNPDKYWVFYHKYDFEQELDLLKIQTLNDLSE